MPIDFKLDDLEVPVTKLDPEEANSVQCRICLLEGAEENDPLVRACQCKGTSSLRLSNTGSIMYLSNVPFIIAGSIMYVHLDCLRHWVNGRLNLSVMLTLTTPHPRTHTASTHPQHMHILITHADAHAHADAHTLSLICAGRPVKVVLFCAANSMRTMQVNIPKFCKRRRT